MKCFVLLLVVLVSYTSGIDKSAVETHFIKWPHKPPPGVLRNDHFTDVFPDPRGSWNVQQSAGRESLLHEEDNVQKWAFADGIYNVKANPLWIYSSQQAKQCLYNRTIAFTGDGYMLQMYIGFVEVVTGVLSGEEILNAPERRRAHAASKKLAKALSNMAKVNIVFMAESCLHESLNCLDSYFIKEIHALRKVDAVISHILNYHVPKLAANDVAPAKYSALLRQIFNKAIINKIPLTWSSQPSQNMSKTKMTPIRDSRIRAAMTYNMYGMDQAKESNVPVIDMQQLAGACMWANCSSDGTHRSRFVNRMKAQIYLNMLCSTPVRAQIETHFMRWPHKPLPGVLRNDNVTDVFPDPRGKWTLNATLRRETAIHEADNVQRWISGNGTYEVKPNPLWIYSSQQAKQCLYNRTIAFTGDSYMVQMFIGFIEVVSGHMTRKNILSGPERHVAFNASRNLSYVLAENNNIRVVFLASECSHETLDCMEQYVKVNAKNLSRVDAMISNYLIHHVINLKRNSELSAKLYAKQLGVIFNYSVMAHIPLTWASGPSLNLTLVPEEFKNTNKIAAGLTHNGYAMDKAAAFHVPVVDMQQLTGACTWADCSSDGNHRARFVNRMKAQLYLNMLCSTPVLNKKPNG